MLAPYTEKTLIFRHTILLYHFFRKSKEKIPEIMQKRKLTASPSPITEKKRANAEALAQMNIDFLSYRADDITKWQDCRFRRSANICPMP